MLEVCHGRRYAVTQGTEDFQNLDVIKRGIPGGSHGSPRKNRIEHYEKLLQAAKDQTERVVRRLLEQERAKLQNDRSKEQPN
jgi:hypothetical protein